MKLLINELEELRAELLQLENEFEEPLASVDPMHRRSAQNLVHYIGLRRKDRRALQDQLARLGLSSLGRAEAHVMANVDAILSLLAQISGAGEESAHKVAEDLEFDTAHALLISRTEALLGPAPPNHQVRIMVTMPSEAANNAVLVQRLLAAGMDCMRINCAHDDDTAWAAMVANLRRAQQQLQRPCKILMDLAGPKIRTGPAVMGPCRLKWQPKRDELGRVMTPARIWITWKDSGGVVPDGADAVLPLEGNAPSVLRGSDKIRFRDARGRKRILSIVGAEEGGVWAEARRTAYVVPGMKMKLETHDHRTENAPELRVGALPPMEKPILLQIGDRLILSDPANLAPDGQKNGAECAAPAAVISCTAPEIFGDLHAGERILLDDGKIAGMIRAVSEGEVEIEITRAEPGGSGLRGDRGVNFPDSTLNLPSLTSKDLRDLDFIVRNADLVNYSWVRRAEDVRALQKELGLRGASQLGVVLKIETQSAFTRFPGLLLASMQTPNIGVMLARGDLAVEVGYERMAEVQEELLCMCEAAHVPLIWATQVLESLAKDGLPSRAEISDAAMAVRAECVMLNKGPFAEEAIRALDDILHRMEGHQSKKRSLLRKLQMAFGI